MKKPTETLLALGAVQKSHALGPITVFDTLMRGDHARIRSEEAVERRPLGSVWPSVVEHEQRPLQGARRQDDRALVLLARRARGVGSEDEQRVQCLLQESRALPRVNLSRRIVAMVQTRSGLGGGVGAARPLGTERESEQPLRRGRRSCKIVGRSRAGGSVAAVSAGGPRGRCRRDWGWRRRIWRIRRELDARL